MNLKCLANDCDRYRHGKIFTVSEGETQNQSYTPIMMQCRIALLKKKCRDFPDFALDSQNSKNCYSQQQQCHRVKKERKKFCKF